MDQATLVHQYIHGLKTQVKLHVRPHNLTTLHDAESLALEADDALFKATPKPPRGDRRDLNAVSTPPSGKLTKLTDKEREYLRKNGGCFKCRKLGHIGTNCPNVFGTSSSSSNPNPRNPRRPLGTNAVETQTAQQSENASRQ